MYIIENKDIRPQFNLALEEYICMILGWNADNMADLDHKNSCDASSAQNIAMDTSRSSFLYKPQFFMLWRNEPSIIVGRFQNTLEEINTEYVKEHGIHVVRRNSGGGAVYQDLGNINYSFIMADEGNLDFSYFSSLIIRALATLGVKAEPTGRNDISIEGKKISGGAQFRTGGVILHHGTLLYDTDLDAMSNALRPPEDKFQSKAVKSMRNRVGNIKQLLPEPLSIIEFQERFKRGIDNSVPMVLDAFSLVEAERLVLEKYSTWAWNYGSSPKFIVRKKSRFHWGGIEALLLIEEGKIAGCTFLGDYFGSGDYSQIQSRLTGIPYTKEDVAKALTGFDPRQTFTGSKYEDIVELLAP
jgi:lipoate-protein ligase A